MNRLAFLAAITLVSALAVSGTAHALTPRELPAQRTCTFNRSFDLWRVDTGTEFDQGVLNGVDTSSRPGDVRLAMRSDWYDASWSSRAAVTVSNSGSARADYQVRVDVAHDADMQPDFDDIRFTDADGATSLSHWREIHVAATSAVFWVRVPTISAGGKTIHMYYGNAGASSASDGNATFVLPGSEGSSDRLLVDCCLMTEYADPEPTTSVGAEEGPYLSSGTVASRVYDTVEVDARWDLLGWDRTLPSGANTTFEVRASNTVFAGDAATPVWQDASVLPTGRYQQWRATLTSNASHIGTPILHEVWGLYSW